jgi:hypothetical protein
VSAIGLQTCPSRGSGNCGGSIGSLQALATCVECVADLDVDCADRNSVPGLDVYPAQCTPPPMSGGKLDYTKTPTAGTLNLGAGFAPDPATIAVNSGGSVDVSYLGSSCSGFTTAAPSVRVNYGGGGAPLLRLYITANADTTLVVNDPFGNFYCVDDSFGTVNPTIDFNNPAGGTYDIWSASFAGNVFPVGTLFVTGTSANHP